MEPGPLDADNAPPPRRRFLPWAVGITVAVVGVTVGLALTRGDDGTAAAEGGQTGGSLPGGVVATDQPAPEFSADLFDGTTFRLSDHQETDRRPVLLNLWASWCFPCREEMPALDIVAGRHPEVFFIGVAVEDDPVAAQDFAEEVGVEYTLGIDETDRVAESYEALGLPATFLISADGRLVGKLFGGANEATFEAFVTGLIGT